MPSEDEALWVLLACEFVECQYQAMTQPHECEVRFGIDDIEDFQARLGRMGIKNCLPSIGDKHTKRTCNESIDTGPEWIEVLI